MTPTTTEVTPLVVTAITETGARAQAVLYWLRRGVDPRPHLDDFTAHYQADNDWIVVWKETI